MQQLIKTVIFEGSKSEQIALDYDNNDTIINFNIQNKYALMLTQNGEVFKIGDITSSKSLIQDFSKEQFLKHRPVRFLGLNKEKITQISCSSTVGLLLSQNGSLYAVGNDTNHTGILGYGSSTHLLSSPQQIPNFQRKSIKYVNIGEKHAVAVDTKGQLYTWGSGSCEELGFKGQIKQQEPKKVNIKELYGTQKVYAQNNLTAVLTSGGSLYFMGNLEKGNQKIENIDLEDTKQQHLDTNDIILHKPSSKSDLYFKQIIIKNEFIFALSASKSKIFAYIDTESNTNNQLYEWDILTVNKHPFIKAHKNLLNNSPSKKKGKKNQSNNNSFQYDLAQIDIASLPPDIQNFHNSVSSLDIISSEQSRFACIQFYQHQSLTNIVQSASQSQKSIPIFQSFTDTPIGGGSGKSGRIPQMQSFFQNQDQLNQSISKLDDSTFSRNYKNNRSASKTNAKDLINSFFPSKEDKDNSILSQTQRSGNFPREFRQQSYSLNQRQQNRINRQIRKESENQNPDTSRISSVSKSHISRLDGFEREILMKKHTLKNRNQNNTVQNDNVNLSKSFFGQQDPHNISHSYTDQNILNDQSVYQGQQHRYFFNLNNSQNNSMMFQQGNPKTHSVDIDTTQTGQKIFQQQQQQSQFLSPDNHHNSHINYNNYSNNQSLHEDSQGESQIQRQIRQMRHLHKKQQLDDSMHDYEHQYNIKERADALRQNLIQNNIHQKIDNFIKMSPNRTKILDETNNNVSQENIHSERKNNRSINPQRVEHTAEDFENYQKKQQEIVQKNIIKKYQKQPNELKKQLQKREKQLFRRNSFIERWNSINAQQLGNKPGEVGRPLEYFLKLIEGQNSSDIDQLLNGLTDELIRASSEDPQQLHRTLQEQFKQSYLPKHKKKPSYSLENRQKYNNPHLSEQENESQSSSHSPKDSNTKITKKYKLSGLSSSNNNSQNSSFNNKKSNKKQVQKDYIESSSNNNSSSQQNSEDSDEKLKKKSKKRKNKKKQKKQSHDSNQSQSQSQSNISENKKTPEHIRKKSDLNELLDKFNNQSPLQQSQKQAPSVPELPSIQQPQSKSSSKIQNIKNKIEQIRLQKEAKSQERQKQLQEMQDQHQKQLNQFDQEKQKRNQNQQNEISPENIDNIRNSTYQKRRKCDNLSQDSQIPQGFIESEKEKGFKKNIGDTFTPIEPKSPLMVFQSNPQSTQNNNSEQLTPFQQLLDSNNQGKAKPTLERQGSFGSQPQNTSDFIDQDKRKTSNDEILPHFPTLQKEDLIDLQQYEQELNQKDPKLRAIEEKTERAIQAILDDKTFNNEQKKHFITALTTKSPQKSNKKIKKEISVIDEEQEEEQEQDASQEQQGLQNQEELVDYILNKQRQKEEEKHDLQQLIQEMGGEITESNIENSQDEHQDNQSNNSNEYHDNERRSHVIKLMKVTNMDEEKKGQFINSLVQQYSPIKPNRIVEELDIIPTIETNESLKDKAIMKIENTIQLSPEQKRKLTESIQNISNFDQKDKKQIDKFLETKKKQTPAQQKLEEIQEVFSQNEELVKSLVGQTNSQTQDQIIDQMLQNQKLDPQNQEQVQEIIQQVLNDDQIQTNTEKQEIIQKLLQDTKQQEIQEFLQSQSNLRNRNNLTQSQLSPIQQLEELAKKDTKIQNLAKSLVIENNPQKEISQKNTPEKSLKQSLRKSSNSSQINQKQEETKEKLKKSIANMKIADEILQSTNQPITEQNKKNIVEMLEDVEENPYQKQEKIVKIIQNIEQGLDIQEIAKKDNTVLSKSLKIQPEDKLKQIIKSNKNINRLAKQITDKNITPLEQEHIIEEILEQVDNQDNEESKQILRQILSDDTIPTQSQRKKFIEESIKHLQDDEIQHYFNENPQLQNRIINESNNSDQNQNKQNLLEKSPQEQLEFIIQQDQKSNRLAKMYSTGEQSLNQPEKLQEQQKNILKESGVQVSKQNTQILSQLIDDPEISEEEQQDLIKEFINQGQQGLPIEEIQENIENVKRKAKRIKKSKTTPSQKLNEILNSEKEAKLIAKSLLIQNVNNPDKTEQIQEFILESDIPQTQENQTFVKSIIEKPSLSNVQKQQMLEQLVIDSKNKKIDEYLENNQDLSQKLKKSILKQSGSQQQVQEQQDSRQLLQQLVKQQQRASTIAINIVNHSSNPASATPEEIESDSQELLNKVLKEAQLQENPYTKNLVNSIIQNTDLQNPLTQENQQELIEELINQGQQGKSPQEIQEQIEKVKRQQRRKNISKSQYNQNLTPKQKIEQVKQQQAKSKQLVQSLVLNNNNNEPLEKQELIKNLLESNQQEPNQKNIQQISQIIDNKLKTPQQKQEILSEIIQQEQTKQMEEYINKNPNYQKRIKNDNTLKQSTPYEQIKQLSQDERRSSKLASSFLQQEQQNPIQQDQNIQEICEESGFKPTQKNKDLVKSLLTNQKIVQNQQEKYELVKEIISKGKQGEEIQQIVSNKVSEIRAITPTRKDSSQFFNTNTSQIENSAEKSQNTSYFNPNQQQKQQQTPYEKLQDIEKTQENIQKIIKKLVNCPIEDQKNIQIISEDLLDQVNENNSENLQTIQNILNDPKLKTKSQKTQQIEDLIGQAMEQEIADYITETIEDKQHQIQKVNKLSQSGYTPQEQLEELSKQEKKTKKIIKQALKQSQNLPDNETQNQLAKSILKEALQQENIQNIDLMKEVLQENNNTYTQDEKVELLMNIVEESQNQEKDLNTIIQEKKQEQLQKKRIQSKQNKRLSKSLKPNEKIQQLQDNKKLNKQLTQSLLENNDILQEKLYNLAQNKPGKSSSFLEQAQRKKDQQEINKLKKTNDDILENLLNQNINDNPVEYQQQKEAISNLVNNPDINTEQKQDIIEDILYQTQEQQIEDYIDQDQLLFNRKNRLSASQNLMPSQQLQELAKRDKNAKKLAKTIVYKGEFDKKQIKNLLSEAKVNTGKENQLLVKQVLQLNQNPTVQNINQQAEIIQEIISRGQAGEELEQIIQEIKEKDEYQLKQQTPQEVLENYEISKKLIQKQASSLVKTEDKSEQKHIIEEILESAGEQKNKQNINVFDQILNEPETSQKEKEKQINQLLEDEQQQKITDYISQSLIIKKSDKKELKKSKLPPSQQLEKIIEQHQKQSRLIKSITSGLIPNENDQITEILKQANLEQNSENKNLLKPILKASKNDKEAIEKLVNQVCQNDEPLEEIIQDVQNQLTLKSTSQHQKSYKSLKSMKSLASLNSQSQKLPSQIFAEQTKNKINSSQKLEQIKSISQKQKEIAKSLVKEKNPEIQQSLINEFLDQTEQNNQENQQTIQTILQDQSLITPSQKQQVLYDLIQNEEEQSAQNYIDSHNNLHPRIQSLITKNSEPLSSSQVLEELAYQDQKAKNMAKSLVLQSKTKNSQIDPKSILKEANLEINQENKQIIQQILEEQTINQEKPYIQQENQEIIIEEIIKQGQSGVQIEDILENINNVQQQQQQNENTNQQQEIHSQDNLIIPTPRQKIEEIQNKKRNSQNLIQTLLNPRLSKQKQDEALVNLLKSENLHNEQNQQIISQILQDEQINDPIEKEEIISNMILKTEEDEIQDYLVSVAQQDPIAMNILNNLASQGLQPKEQLQQLAQTQANHQNTIQKVINSPKNIQKRQAILNQILENATPQQQEDEQLHQQVNNKLESILLPSFQNLEEAQQEALINSLAQAVAQGENIEMFSIKEIIHKSKNQSLNNSQINLNKVKPQNSQKQPTKHDFIMEKAFKHNMDQIQQKFQLISQLVNTQEPEFLQQDQEQEEQQKQIIDCLLQEGQPNIEQKKKLMLNIVQDQKIQNSQEKADLINEIIDTGFLDTQKVQIQKLVTNSSKNNLRKQEDIDNLEQNIANILVENAEYIEKQQQEQIESEQFILNNCNNNNQHPSDPQNLLAQSQLIKEIIKSDTLSQQEKVKSIISTIKPSDQLTNKNKKRIIKSIVLSNQQLEPKTTNTLIDKLIQNTDNNNNDNTKEIITQILEDQESNSQVKQNLLNQIVLGENTSKSAKEQEKLDKKIEYLANNPEPDFQVISSLVDLAPKSNIVTESSINQNQLQETAPENNYKQLISQVIQNKNIDPEEKQSLIKSVVNYAKENQLQNQDNNLIEQLLSDEVDKQDKLEHIHQLYKADPQKQSIVRSTITNNSISNDEKQEILQNIIKNDKIEKLINLEQDNTTQQQTIIKQLVKNDKTKERLIKSVISNQISQKNPESQKRLINSILVTPSSQNNSFKNPQLQQKLQCIQDTIENPQLTTLQQNTLLNTILEKQDNQTLKKKLIQSIILEDKEKTDDEKQQLIKLIALDKKEQEELKIENIVENHTKITEPEQQIQLQELINNPVHKKLVEKVLENKEFPLAQKKSLVSSIVQKSNFTKQNSLQSQENLKKSNMIAHLVDSETDRFQQDLVLNELFKSQNIEQNQDLQEIETIQAKKELIQTIISDKKADSLQKSEVITNIIDQQIQQQKIFEVIENVQNNNNNTEENQEFIEQIETNPQKKSLIKSIISSQQYPSPVKNDMINKILTLSSVQQQDQDDNQQSVDENSQKIIEKLVKSSYKEDKQSEINQEITQILTNSLIDQSNLRNSQLQQKQIQNVLQNQEISENRKQKEITNIVSNSILQKQQNLQKQASNILKSQKIENDQPVTSVNNRLIQSVIDDKQLKEEEKQEILVQILQQNEEQKETEQQSQDINQLVNNDDQQLQDKKSIVKKLTKDNNLHKSAVNFVVQSDKFDKQTKSTLIKSVHFSDKQKYIHKFPSQKSLNILSQFNKEKITQLIQNTQQDPSNINNQENQEIIEYLINNQEDIDQMEKQSQQMLITQIIKDQNQSQDDKLQLIQELTNKNQELQNQKQSQNPYQLLAQSNKQSPTIVQGILKNATPELRSLKNSIVKQIATQKAPENLKTSLIQQIIQQKNPEENPNEDPISPKMPTPQEIIKQDKIMNLILQQQNDIQDNQSQQIEQLLEGQQNQELKKSVIKSIIQDNNDNLIAKQKMINSILETENNIITNNNQQSQEEEDQQSIKIQKILSISTISQKQDNKNPLKLSQDQKLLIKDLLEDNLDEGEIDPLQQSKQQLISTIVLDNKVSNASKESLIKQIVNQDQHPNQQQQIPGSKKLSRQNSQSQNNSIKNNQINTQKLSRSIVSEYTTKNQKKTIYRNLAKSVASKQNLEQDIETIIQNDKLNKKEQQQIIQSIIDSSILQKNIENALFQQDPQQQQQQINEVLQQNQITNPEQQQQVQTILKAKSFNIEDKSTLIKSLVESQKPEIQQQQQEELNKPENYANILNQIKTLESQIVENKDTDIHKQVQSIINQTNSLSQSQISNKKQKGQQDLVKSILVNPQTDQKQKLRLVKSVITPSISNQLKQSQGQILSQSQVQSKNLKKRLVQSIVSQDEQLSQKEKQEKLESLLITKKIRKQSIQNQYQEMIEIITDPNTQENIKQEYIDQLVSVQSLNNISNNDINSISNTESDIDNQNSDIDQDQEQIDSDNDFPFSNNDLNNNNKIISQRNSIIQDQIEKQQKIEEIVSQNNLRLEEKKQQLIPACEEYLSSQEYQSQKSQQQQEEQNSRKSQIIENLITKQSQLSHPLKQRYISELVGDQPESQNNLENIINNSELNHQQKYNTIKQMSNQNNTQDRKRMINSLVYETGNKQELIKSLTQNIQENKDEKKNLIDHIVKDTKINISTKEKIITVLTEPPSQHYINKRLVKSIVSQKKVQKPEDKKRLIQSLLQQNTTKSTLKQSQKDIIQKELDIEQILLENNNLKKQSMTKQLLSQSSLNIENKELVQKLLTSESKTPVELNIKEQDQVTESLLTENNLTQKQLQQSLKKSNSLKQSQKLFNKSNSQIYQSPQKSLNQSQISNQSLKNQSEKKLNKILEQSQNLQGEEQDQKIEEAKNLLRLSQSFRNSEKSSPIRRSQFSQQNKHISPIEVSRDEQLSQDNLNYKESPIKNQNQQQFPQFMQFNEEFEGVEEQSEKVKRKGIRSKGNTPTNKISTPLSNRNNNSFNKQQQQQQYSLNKSQNSQQQQQNDSFSQASPQVQQIIKKNGYKSSYLNDETQEKSKSPSKFKLAVIKMMAQKEDGSFNQSPQSQKSDKPEKFNLKKAAQQLLEQHTKSPLKNPQGSSSNLDQDYKPKKTLKEKAEQLKQSILSKKQESPILPHRNIDDEPQVQSQVQSLNNSQLQQLQNQQLRDLVQPVHLQRSNSSLNQQLKGSPIQRQFSSHNISSQQKLNDSQNIGHIQESPIKNKSPYNNNQNLQESLLSNPIHIEDNQLNTSTNSQKIQYLQQLRHSRQQKPDESNDIFKGKSSSVKPKKTIESILQQQQQREKSLLKQGSEIIKDNIDINKEISLDNSFSSSPNKLISSLMKTKSLNTSQIQNKLSNSTSNPQFQHIQSQYSNQQQQQQSLNNSQYQDQLLQQQQQNQYVSEQDPINQILKHRTPSRSPSHRSLKDQANQTMQQLNQKSYQNTPGRYFSPQRRVIQPSTYKSNYPPLNSPTHQELSELIDRECDEITYQFMQKVFPHRPLGNNQSFNLNITNQSMFNASPFKNLRKSDKVGLVVLLKLEKFLLKRKYHAFTLMKLLYFELKAKEQQMQQQEESIVQQHEPVYAYQKQQLVQKKLQQESQENQLLIRKKEGYARLAISLNNIVNSRKKQTLSKIGDEHKLLMSYNLFNLLLTNFGKIFQNNIHKKLQYSFSKIYYFNRQSQINSANVTQSLNTSNQNIRGVHHQNRPSSSLNQSHRQHINKIDSEIQHLNEQILQSQKQQAEYDQVYQKQQKTNELLNLCQDVLQGQKPLLSLNSPNSSVINNSKQNFYLNSQQTQQNESDLNMQEYDQNQEDQIKEQEAQMREQLNQRIKSNLKSPQDKNQQDYEQQQQQQFQTQKFESNPISERKNTQKQLQLQQQQKQQLKQSQSQEKNIIFNKQKNRPLTAQEIKRMQFISQNKSPNTTLMSQNSPLKQNQQLAQSMSARSKFQQQQQQQQQEQVSIVSQTYHPQQQLQKSHSTQGKQLQSVNSSVFKKPQHDPAAQRRLYGPQTKSFGQSLSKPPPRLNQSLQHDFVKKQVSQSQFQTQRQNKSSAQQINNSMIQQQYLQKSFQQQNMSQDHSKSFNQSNFQYDKVIQSQKQYIGDQFKELEQQASGKRSPSSKSHQQSYQYQQQSQQQQKQQQSQQQQLVQQPEIEDLDMQMREQLKKSLKEQQQNFKKSGNLNSSTLNLSNNPNDTFQPTVFYNKPQNKHLDYNKYFK